MGVALEGITVFKWFVVCFGIDLLPLYGIFSLLLTVYATLDYVHYGERGEERERYQFICTLSLCVRFELVQVHLKRFMLITIFPGNSGNPAQHNTS